MQHIDADKTLGEKARRELHKNASSSVSIRDVALRTSRKQWTIGRCGERGSEISMLIARHDDDDDDDDE